MTKKRCEEFFGDDNFLTDDEFRKNILGAVVALEPLLRSILSQASYSANELHPTEQGFNKIVFLQAAD
jgi:hypothetical protein